jgi:L-alanine-DL-glutamate epimerase-like enolase superfamily enzyme
MEMNERAVADNNVAPVADADNVVERVVAAVVEAPLDAYMRAYGSSRVSFVLVGVVDALGRPGTGFTYTLGLGAVAVRAMIDDVLSPLVIGTDTATWTETYQSMNRQTRRLGRSVFAPAISALDIAMYDLRAIQADVPLYRLLGRTPTDVPIYGSGRSSNTLDIQRLVDGSVGYVAEGYRAVKVRVGAGAVEEDLRRVAEVREAVGPQIRLMVDANEQLDLPRAIALADGLHPLGVDWLEEPFLAEDIAAHAAFTERSPLPIAAGEHLVGEYEFASYIRDCAADMFQPDAALTGGITATLRIAALAETHRVPIAFHSLPELHVHLAMSAPNVRYVEHFPILDPLLSAPLAPTAGRVTAPHVAGHGIAWNERARAALSLGA